VYVPISPVSGGAGFIRAHLGDYLGARGHEPICVDNLDTGSLQNIQHIAHSDDFVFVSHDLTQPLFLDHEVDYVFRLASPARPIDYRRLPLHTLKVGSYGTHHMLGLAKFKCARSLLASTSEVYRDPGVNPQSETYWGTANPIGPRGVHDQAKRHAEAMTMAYHRQPEISLEDGLRRLTDSASSRDGAGRGAGPSSRHLGKPVETANAAQPSD
jgi:dTDP-glucose 4,6-dehydratase